MRKNVAVAAALAGLAVALPAGAEAAPAKLVATVGPGHTISLRTASGATVRTVKAGLYTIVVRDRSADHDFRLMGPGVNRATSVGAVATTTWKVRLARGKTYRFVCDPHIDEMFGSFKVR
jgi:hypothetical protein